MTSVDASPPPTDSLRRTSLAATVPPIAIVVTAAYIGAQMLSDIASVKIGLVGGLAVDMGTFVYPITFTLRDVVHKVLGKRNAQVMIVTAGVINLVMAAYLWWTARVPSDPGWGLGEAYSAVLSPITRIVVASIVAEIVSELLDTEIYHWFVTRVTRRRQWLRVLVSNSLSVPVDNVIFSVLAFAPIAFLGSAGLEWAVVWEIFVWNLVVKYAVTVISLPLIYIVPDRDPELQ